MKVPTALVVPVSTFNIILPPVPLPPTIVVAETKGVVYPLPGLTNSISAKTPSFLSINGLTYK